MSWVSICPSPMRHPQKAAALSFLLLSLSFSSAARAAGPFTHLAGYWGGEGTIKMTNGASERIRCKGSYAVATGGNAIEQKLRCASDSYKFEISSNIIASGSSISGSWIETTRNASGEITGVVSPSLINARIDGAGFSAGIAIATVGRRQSVTFTTQGSTDIASVTVTMHRS